MSTTDQYQYTPTSISSSTQEEVYQHPALTDSQTAAINAAVSESSSANTSSDSSTASSTATAAHTSVSSDPYAVQYASAANGASGYNANIANPYGADEGKGEEPNTNLFVNYLPPDVFDEGLYSYFSRFGEIVSAKVMVDLATRTSKCFGFVKYKSIESARLALQLMNGNKISDKTLLVKYAATEPTSRATTDSNNIGTPNTNLCIKGLPVAMTLEEVKYMFGIYGTITKSALMKDNVTGMSRGMGFVEFSNLTEATNALKALNGYLIPPNTRPLQVRYADNEAEKQERKTKKALMGGVPPRPYPGYPPYGGYSPYGTVAGRGAPYAGSPSARYAPYAPQYGYQAPPGGAYAQGYYMAPGAQYYGAEAYGAPPVSGGGPMRHHGASAVSPAVPGAYAQGVDPAAVGGVGHDNNVFIYYLPTDADDALLYKLFSPFGAIASVKVMKDPNTGLCKGFGFVKMTNYNDAWNAIQGLNGKKVGDKCLSVSFKK